jgi:hypothetical protein
VRTHIFCIYRDINRANDAVDRLLSAGIGRRHIRILNSEQGGASHLALSQDATATDRDLVRNIITKRTPGVLANI